MSKGIVHGARMAAAIWLGAIAMAMSAGVAPAASAASSDQLARGQALLESNCSRCHAIGPAGASPFGAAPPFRTLHERYPVETLEEALAEGIISGHPVMPEFVFAPGEIDDIIAYLKSLQP